MASRYKNMLFLLFFLVSLQALQAQSLRRVVAAPFQPGSAAVMRFELEIKTPISPTWKLGIILPDEFNQENLLLAASQRLNGGFLVAVRGDTAWIERGGTGDRATDAALTDLSIASIGLPQDLQRAYPFVFIQQDSSQQSSFQEP